MFQYDDAYIYIMLICKGANIWSSVHEKVTQHWGWVEKMRFLLKKCVGIECLITPINWKLWRCKIYVKYLVLFTSYLTANLSIITCRFICMQKINFICNFTFEILLDIASLLFWELWECLTIPIKNHSMIL